MVIAIIAILSALLFPALQTAKEKSRQILCANNLKQIYVALSSYALDYNEYFPVLYGNGVCYQSIIQHNVGACPTGLGVLYPSYLSSGQVFYCPSASVQGSENCYARFTHSIGRPGDNVYMQYIYGVFYVCGNKSTLPPYVRSTSVSPENAAIVADATPSVSAVSGLLSHNGTYASVLHKNGAVDGKYRQACPYAWENRSGGYETEWDWWDWATK